MSDRAFEFVYQWVAEHVAPTIFQEENDCGEAETMAEELLDVLKRMAFRRRKSRTVSGTLLNS